MLQVFIFYKYFFMGHLSKYERKIFFDIKKLRNELPTLINGMLGVQIEICHNRINKDRRKATYYEFFHRNLDPTLDTSF